MTLKKVRSKTWTNQLPLSGSQSYHYEGIWDVDSTDGSLIKSAVMVKLSLDPSNAEGTAYIYDTGWQAAANIPKELSSNAFVDWNEVSKCPENYLQRNEAALLDEAMAIIGIVF